MAGSVSPRLWLVPVRPVVWLLLVMHVATAVGAPIPAVSIVSSAVRFPCESHGCGCASAEQCWRSCCCFTTTQKLAWAKANDVTPPDDLKPAEAKPAQSKPAKRSCCSTDKSPAACESKPSTACDTSPKASCCEKEKVEAAPKEELTWLLAVRAQRCRGQAGTWLHAEPTVIPLPIEISAADAPCIERLVLLPESALSPTLTPPVPPPRPAAQPV